MARECPRCGREQPETSTGEKCLFCGEILPAEKQAAPSPDASPAHTPLVPPPPPEDEDELEPGKRKCPECGEVLYDTEERCWRCGAVMETQAAEPEPVALSPVAAPHVTTPPAVVSAPPPVTPTQAATPPPPPVDRQAAIMGMWSLILGIAGLFCCAGLTGPVAIVLGMRASRGGSPLGVIGIVLGIIGTIVLLVMGALGVIGYFTEKSAIPTPEGAVLLPVIQPLVTLVRSYLGA